MRQENILNELWSYFEEKPKEKWSKTDDKVHNFLNYDNLSSIILDGNVFWIEKTTSYTVIPNYIYRWIVKFYEKRGYMYLFKIKIKQTIEGEKF